MYTNMDFLIFQSHGLHPYLKLDSEFEYTPRRGLSSYSVYDILTVYCDGWYYEGLRRTKMNCGFHENNNKDVGTLQKKQSREEKDQGWR